MDSNWNDVIVVGITSINSFQVIDELSSRLEQRETQLLTVSKDKAKLEEECDNLKE